MNTLRAPSKGRLAARRTISLTCPIVVNAPWGTISVRSGCSPLSALSSAATSPPATSAAPNLSATIRLPTPGGPWNRYACETSQVFWARPSSRSAVSFPSTPSNLSCRSLTYPPSFARFAQTIPGPLCAATSRDLTSILQVAHPTYHQPGEIPGLERGIQNFDPPGLQARQFLESLFDTPHEVGPYRLDPVGSRPELSGPPLPLVLVEAQVESPVGHDGPYGVGIQSAYRLDAEFPPEALVGEARIQVALAKHVLAAFETRENRPPHVISAGGRVQIRLRPRVHISLRIQDDLPDALGHRCAAGLSGEVCGRLRACKQRSDGAYKGGLARVVRALDRYEDAPLCALPGLRGGPSS